MSENGDNEAITPEIVEDEAGNESGLISPQSFSPDRIFLLPMSGRPFFPAQIQPLVVSGELWESTIARIESTDHRMLGLSYVPRTQQNNELTKDHFSRVGCAVRIHDIKRENGHIQFVAQGLRRFAVEEFLTSEIPFLAKVAYPVSEDSESDKIRAYAMAIINTIKELLPLSPLYGEGLKDYLLRFNPNDPSPLSDFAATLTTATGDELQVILETVPVITRMEKVLVILKKELDVVRIQSEITQEMNRNVNENQRKFFLKEQLKIIQKELGIAKDDRTADIDQFEEKLTKLKVPDHVKDRFDNEIQKLSVLEKGSSEYGVSRNYLDWITSIPWGVYSEDKLDIKAARKTLEKHHSGLDDVKERIIEFLAVGVYKGEVSGSIMLLVGPPGVGKTSIGKSIADALGRKFYRFSLGGMRDEAEIKGHRRTYVGAMPGKFMQALRETGVSNPVIMLDEVDKIGASYQGDPASALLEALDPEQNKDFLDHYFDLRADLSKVLFICTANQLDTIPRPLLDRMDVTSLSGYITKEKVDIAKRHLWPRQLEKNGLTTKQIKISDTAIRQIVEGYAREAGVRTLEKMLNKILRKAVVKILETNVTLVNVDTKNLEEYLGSPYFRKDKTITGVGVVTGLAWTSMGGATLPVEATMVHDKGKGFKLTGKLGEVMRESAEIAYSFISSHIKEFKGDDTFFQKAFIHLHVPEGATPKDGPSAGVTMATALLSLALGKQIRGPLAMTGELTLTGKVLPVGGIREKVIAARRLKIMELIVPFDNQRDINELPDYIKEGMTIHFAEKYKDIQKLIF
ncbi:MAG: endopeptidase La [Desulfobacteraceae bacterium]|jgi:ATP-dependent Lon protease